MNWDAIAAIGQVLGSIAVFITLVYLSVQTRHARSEARRALSQRHAEAVRAINSVFAGERVASVWTKAMTALESPGGPAMVALMQQAKLTQEEAFTVVTVSRTLWSDFLRLIPHMDELPAIERRSIEDTIRLHYGNVGPSRIFYEYFLKTRAHPDAVRYVDNLLAQPG